jgi:hypothetical protein
MYRIKATGQLATQGEVRQMFKSTSLPKVWDDSVCEFLGIDPVFEGPQATPTNVYEFSMRQGVEEINGKWYTKYVLGPIFTDTQEATAAEQEAAYKARKDAEVAANVRSTRDGLLTASDWTQVADAPVDQAAWAAYRQALRDVPAQAGFPHHVTWPTKPE